MTSEIRSKMLLCLGVVALVVGCSSTSLSQTPCYTLTPPSGSEFTPDDGWKIVSVKTVGDKTVIRVCGDNTANASPSQQPSTQEACPNPPAQQSTSTATETPEEVRRRRQEEAAERRQNRVKEPGNSAREGRDVRDGKN